VPGPLPASRPFISAMETARKASAGLWQDAPDHPTDGSMPQDLSRSKVQSTGLWLGLVLFVVLLLLPPPAEFAPAAWRTAALAALMAVWWATEALPIPATAVRRSS